MGALIVLLLGVTLVAFLRGDGFNVYSRPDRVALR